MARADPGGALGGTRAAAGRDPAFAWLLGAHLAPCLSLYMPTHRSYPSSQQDPIRFRNLLRDAGRELAATHAAAAVDEFLAPLRRIADDQDFWIHGTDGLAVLAAPGELRVYRLSRAVPERVVVADSFHAKPLVRILQSADRFQVLCIDRAKAWLWEGTRDSLAPVPLEGMPTTITEALGEQLTDPQVRMGRSSSRGVAGSGAMYDGQGGRADERQLDRERFFRAIDRGIAERYSKPGGLPLILAALPEHQAHFRGASHNPNLVAQGIEKDPGALDADAMRRLAWEVLEPLWRQRLATLAERYGEARAHGRGTDSLAEAAAAVVQGRIDALIVEEDRTIPGRIDASGRLFAGEIADPASDDALDDLAEHVLRSGGEVVVVPRERMPTATGLAAIYRY